MIKRKKNIIERGKTIKRVANLRNKIQIICVRKSFKKKSNLSKEKISF